MANVTHIYGNEVTDAAARGSLAPAYSASSTYAVGDLVLHEGQLYECSTAISTAEEWTTAHWTAKTVADEVSSLKGGITEITTGTSEDIGKALSPKTVSSGKVTEWKYVDVSGGGGSNVGIINVADYGAVGDGVTDDSQAIQDACDAGYDIYFESGKTYYLASEVTIDHDIYLHGGENTVIKTKTPSGGTVNNAFVVTGTLKKTTTLTTDYVTVGSSDNGGNQFTLSDMTGIDIGDIMIIKAEDQYYSYARQYYYLGATLLITDMYSGHVYTCDNMPWDIENTANVSVNVYNAPNAIFENLNFESDLDSIPTYRYFITLMYCKNSVVRNCSMSYMPDGINVYHSVNTEIDSVNVAKSKYDNSIVGDGYGIEVQSSTNTIIRRVIALCSQGCIELGGQIPNLNTYIYNCKVASECRPTGIDLHENSYNIVIEDCVLGGVSLQGTAIVNRCRFIGNKRTNTVVGISLYGSHNPKWAKFRVRDCEFDDGLQLQINRPSPQAPIQAFENHVGLVEVVNCNKVATYFTPDVNTYVTKNVLHRLSVDNCSDLGSIYHTTDTTNLIEYLNIVDSSFAKKSSVRVSSVDEFNAVGIKYLSVRNNNPRADRINVEIKKDGGKYILPENVPVAFSSSDSSARYWVCGENFASNNPNDYQCGNVTASEGGTLTRSVNSRFSSSLSQDLNGNLVFSQPSDYSTKADIYPLYLAYINEPSVIRASCVLKNTGATDGATFRVFLVVVDCETGKVVTSNRGSGKQASASGETISHSMVADNNTLVLCFLTCTGAVLGSVTTFENFVVKALPGELDESPVVYVAYNGSSRTGNGSLNSVQGTNYIMSSLSTYTAKFKVDYLIP